MSVREQKLYTIKTNRSGTCIWKPIGKPGKTQDKVDKTSQSTDKTFSCDSWGKNQTNQSHKTTPTTLFQEVHTFYRGTIQILQENGALQMRWVFHGEKRWLSDEKDECCFISLTSKQRWTIGEVAASEILNREGGKTNSFHLIQLEIPAESMKETWNPPHMERHREFQEHINRLMKEEKGERQGWRRRWCQSALWHQGKWERGQDPGLTSKQLGMILYLFRNNIKFKYYQNVSIA